MIVTGAMVDRFLTWPLPESVCADPCATKQGLGRTGTNLLSAIEARQMLEHLLAPQESRSEVLEALACPRPQVMGKHACKNRKQCWEPCGDLGHHEEYASRAEPGAPRRVPDLGPQVVRYSHGNLYHEPADIAKPAPEPSVGYAMHDRIHNKWESLYLEQGGSLTAEQRDAAFTEAMQALKLVEDAREDNIAAFGLLEQAAHARGLEDALEIVSLSSGIPQACDAIRAKIKPT